MAHTEPPLPSQPPAAPPSHLLSHLLLQLGELSAQLGSIAVKGQKLKAARALAQLEELLTSRDSRPVLRLAQLEGRLPPWKQTFGAISKYLRADKTPKPKDVERLDSIVEAAARVGAELSEDGSLDLLLKLALDALCDAKHAVPAVGQACSGTAHSIATCLHAHSAHWYG
eukprot:scaffold55567_cov28-Tisochrysis_lutea.AAC.12